MPKLLEIASLIAVGALWGCTNPLLRRGSASVSSTHQSNTSVRSALDTFRRPSVWLPYVLNQSGSVVYYYSLSSSSLSMAVPICNGLALVFSIVTAWWLGERVRHPTRCLLGSALVVGGVAICITAKEQSS